VNPVERAAGSPGRPSRSHHGKASIYLTMRPFYLFIAFVVSACAHRDGTLLESRTPGTQQRSGEIVLDLRTDKARYRSGDAIQVTLTTNQRANLEIYNLDEQGKRTVIWPRTGTKPVSIGEGESLTLPPQGADWKITAGEPLGVNTLVATAISIPKPTRPRPTASSGPNPQPEFFQMHTGGWKGISVEPTAPTAGSTPSTPSKRATGEARWLYEVKR